MMKSLHACSTQKTTDQAEQSALSRVAADTKHD